MLFQDDTAIVGFIGRYRSALTSGRATRAGEGFVHRTRVAWLRFRGTSQPFDQFVAVDIANGKPLRVETRPAGQPPYGFDLELIGLRDQIPPGIPQIGDRADAHPPHLRSARAVTATTAARLVPGGYWAGPHALGLPLRQIRVLA